MGILKAVFPGDEIEGSLEKMNSRFWFLLPLIFVSSLFITHKYRKLNIEVGKTWLQCHFSHKVGSVMIILHKIEVSVGHMEKPHLF